MNKNKIINLFALSLVFLGLFQSSQLALAEGGQLGKDAVVEFYEEDSSTSSSATTDTSISSDQSDSSGSSSDGESSSGTSLQSTSTNISTNSSYPTASNSGPTFFGKNFPTTGELATKVLPGIGVALIAILFFIIVWKKRKKRG